MTKVTTVKWDIWVVPISLMFGQPLELLLFLYSSDSLFRVLPRWLPHIGQWFFRSITNFWPFHSSLPLLFSTLLHYRVEDSCKTSSFRSLSNSKSITGVLQDIKCVLSVLVCITCYGLHVCLTKIKKSDYFTIQLIFTIIYESYCTFWYYSYVLLYYFS